MACADPLIATASTTRPGDPIAADVVVCGGGVAGAMAAVAAARAGATTWLVERHGFLGGNATAGAVAQFNSWQTAAGRRVVAGLAEEVVQRLRRYGAASRHDVFTMSTGHAMDRVQYAPEVLKLVLDEMVQEAGVTPLLHAWLLDAEVQARQVTAVRLLAKGGVITLVPRVVVDASGDIDLLHKAGAAFLPLEADEALQPATMMFRFGPIDFARFDALGASELAALAQRGHAEGSLARAALHASRDPFSHDGWFNISRLAVDATDALALTRAEMEGRRQAWRAAEFLRTQVPGCGEGRLVAFGTQVGVRETRRVAGDHVLDAAELRRPVRFADAVACGAYPIDIHPAAGGGLHYEPLPADHSYQIPYRCLIPAAFDNAIVAGRGLSATHEALAAVRVMTISMAVGQAAGTAAAMAASAASASAAAAASDGATAPAHVRAVAVGPLQERLLAAQACLA